MSNEGPVYSLAPRLKERCSSCDGHGYLVMHPTAKGELPTGAWCDYCERRGWVPSPFGESVLELLEDMGFGLLETSEDLIDDSTTGHPLSPACRHYDLAFRFLDGQVHALQGRTTEDTEALVAHELARHFTTCEELV